MNALTTIPNAPFNSLTVKPVDGEPRMLDTDLAAKLGFKRPADIRDLVKRHSVELATYGIIRTARINAGKRGRPSFAFYLNKKQALLIVMKSDTIHAEIARAEIISVFKADRHGHLVPVQAAQHVLPEVRRSKPLSTAHTVPAATPEIQTFTTDIGDIKVSLRCLVIDGKPWFIAKDVTDALGYAKSRNAVAAHVKDHQKSEALIRGVSQSRTQTVLNLGGLFSLVLRSSLRKPSPTRTG